MKSIVLAVPQPKFSHAPKRYSPFKSNVKLFFKRYGIIAFFITLLFAGMIFGSIKAGTASSGSLEKFASFFSDTLNFGKNQTPMKTFVNSFTVSFVFAAVLFVLSMSPLGVIFIPVIMTIRGFEYGITSGYLCITYGLKGLAYYITVILLGAFISSLALVYVSQYCIDFSLSLMFSILGKRTTDGVTLKDKLSEMTLNYAYMIILIVFASLVDTGLYYLAGGLFLF